MVKKKTDSQAVDQMVIEFPREGETDKALENLRLLLSGKATLIKKALAVEVLTVNTTDSRISFPWFERMLLPEEFNAYALFLGKLLDLAKSQTRSNAKEKPVGNEKFEFRCFLLRLGFIGDEFKAERKILLSKLTGNPAFKSGSAQKEDTKACTE